MTQRLLQLDQVSFNLPDGRVLFDHLNHTFSTRATGIVGANVAVLRRRDGTTQVVQPGNRIDSSRVVAISSQGVQLEDRAGTYLLKAP